MWGDKAREKDSGPSCPPHNWQVVREVRKYGKLYLFMECLKPGCGAVKGTVEDDPNAKRK